MAGREKPKRKALHRGLDDIINRDASLTARLLGRVNRPLREPLEAPAEDKGSNKPTEESEKKAQPSISAKESGKGAPPPMKQSLTPVPEDGQRAAGKEKRDSDELRLIEPPKQSSQRVERGPLAPATQIPPSNVVLARTTAVPSFESFAERWGFVLKSGGRAGKLRICEVLYNNTYAVGHETFFTSYEKLAKLTNLEKKQCSINVRQLESLGFVERLNIYNTATKQGTEFKLHLEQLPPGERRTPRYYCYNEDLK